MVGGVTAWSGSFGLERLVMWHTHRAFWGIVRRVHHGVLGDRWRVHVEVSSVLLESEGLTSSSLYMTVILITEHLIHHCGFCTVFYNI